MQIKHNEGSMLTENDKNQLSSKKISPFKLFSMLKQQKMKEKEALNEKNPIDELIDKLSQDLKVLKTIDYSDEKTIEKIFAEKEKECYVNKQKIDLIEVVFHALKKNKKNENDILVLRLFFMRMEKFIGLLIPLKVNINDILVKLFYNMKCEKKLKNNILFRIGDIGQKLYILLKGHVGIVIKKEKIIQCTPFEYLKYLIVLHLFQEDNIIWEIILKNKNIKTLEEETISNFLQIFKVYNFLKVNNRLKDDYKTIYDFVQNDLKFKKFFENKYNFSPIIALETLNISKNGVIQLYEFYTRKINSMNEEIKLGLRGSDLFANFIKKQMNNTGIIKPTTQKELLLYFKPYDEGKKTFKNSDDYYQKILSVNEISPNKIMKTTVEDYIQHLEPEIILNDIRMDYENIKYKILEKDKIIQERANIKAFEFFEVNQLYDGAIFGELALKNANSKRTATIITKSECFFGTIIKQYYDLSFRAAQEKSQSRNISFFTRSLIFKGVNYNTFLNKFYYSFKKKTYKYGDVIFKKGEERKSVYFIRKGELQISTTITLKELHDLIIELGGVLNEKFLTDLLNSYEELNRYYLNNKHKIKLCVLKDREIAGFDDMTVNGITMFNCVCSSSDKTEIYELDYAYVKEAKKFEKIFNNINFFVNLKRKVFIKRLIEQRNTMIINEVDKVRKIRKNLKGPKISISISAKNNKYFLNTSKENLIKNDMILSYKQKQKEEYNILFEKRKNKSIFRNEKEKSLKLKKFLTNSNYKSNKEMKNVTKNKEEDIDQILTSFKYNDIDNRILIDSRIRNKIFKNKTKRDKNENKEDNKEKIEIENNLLPIKKSFFSRNPLILDNISMNTNFTKVKFTNEKVKLKTQEFKPLLNNIYIQRTRKNIIPSSQKTKTKKFKGILTPFIMKEHQKKFTEKKNKIYMNNFYYHRQNIFESLLDIDNETVKEYLITPNSSKKKMKVSNTQTDFSSPKKEKEDIFLKNEFKEENKISKKNQTNIPVFNWNKNEEKKKRNKKDVFIDVLCLDNWEEKENFTKRYLSEEII